MNTTWGVFTLFTTTATVAAQTHTPVIWGLLGYQFEAAGMIAAIFGCICARLWSADRMRSRKVFRLSLDLPISALTFAAAMGMVISLRPEPLTGLLYGTGIGVVGEGLFRFAERMVKKSGLFDDEPPAPMALPPTPSSIPPDMQTQIDELDRRTGNVHE